MTYRAIAIIGFAIGVLCCEVIPEAKRIPFVSSMVILVIVLSILCLKDCIHLG